MPDDDYIPEGPYEFATGGTLRVDPVPTTTVTDVDTAAGVITFTTGYTLTPRYNYVITNPAADIWAGTAGGTIITYTGPAPEPLTVDQREWTTTWLTNNFHATTFFGIDAKEEYLKESDLEDIEWLGLP